MSPLINVPGSGQAHLSTFFGNHLWEEQTKKARKNETSPICNKMYLVWPNKYRKR